jgi:predicted CoA-binding protein
MSETIPIPPVRPPDEELARILKEAKTIAVVGLSNNPDKDSHHIARYLQDHGYRIIPVNPGATEILGEKAYASLLDIPGDIAIDIVDIFRRPADVGPVVDDAIRRGTKTVWMQLGIANSEAAARARQAGLHVVMDTCIMMAHGRLVEP